jgi:RecB family endonuclease NucS
MRNPSLRGGWSPNPGGILEDGPLLIIGRQVPTDLGKWIDLLGVDREGNVAVVELKRDRTPRDVVAQALEYAAYAARLDVDELEGNPPRVS